LLAIAEASDVVPLPDAPKMWMRLGNCTLACPSNAWLSGGFRPPAPAES